MGVRLIYEHTRYFPTIHSLVDAPQIDCPDAITSHFVFDLTDNLRNLSYFSILFSVYKCIVNTMSSVFFPVCLVCLSII